MARWYQESGANTGGQSEVDQACSLWEHGFYFFALDPKLVPKTGNLRCGNNKMRETG
jgi:hypothetical protein